MMYVLLVTQEERARALEPSTPYPHSLSFVCSFIFFSMAKDKLLIPKVTAGGENQWLQAT